MRKDWRVIKCVSCRGYGVVDGYDAGPQECRECCNGYVYILPDGTLALWPGGPFAGKGTREEWENAHERE